MAVQYSGPWDQAAVAAFFRQAAYPLRLACVGEDGYPRVVSVWFEYRDGVICCASHNSSQLVALLSRNNRVGFEVGPNEPPYCGVRGQGDVRLEAGKGGAVLRRLLQRYLGGTESPLARWLLSREAEEVLITVTPRRLFSWDYRERMSGAS